MTNPPEDPRVAASIRQAAATWAPPAVSDVAPWQDRIVRRRRPAARIRLIGAIGGALALTVALAFGAVWLNSRPNPLVAAPVAAPSIAAPSGSAPQASAPPASTPAPTAGPAAPLPTFAVFGAPIPPTRLVVQGDGYQVVDLASGRVAPAALTWSTNSGIEWLADGRPLEIIGTTTTDTGGIEHLRLAIRRYTANLERDGAEVPIDLAFTGIPAAAMDPGTSWNARAVAGGQRLLVSWASHEESGWDVGIALVDPATGKVLDRRAISVNQGRKGTTLWAPEPTLSADGADAVLRVASSSDTVIGADPHIYHAVLSEAAITSVSEMERGLGSLVAAPCTNGGMEVVRVAAEGVAAICRGDSTVILRRVALDGSPIGDTDLGGAGLTPSSWVHGSAGGTSGSDIWLWDPYGHGLGHVDLATGQVLASARLDLGSATVSPFDAIAGALGRWLAPSAVAKFYLQPSIALAPDGSRVYLIATTAQSPAAEGGSGASLGVTVVDTATLSVVARWAPRADYVSIGVSADGARVIVVGLPGADASGAEAPNQASVLVLDAATGEPRVIAGALGSNTLMLQEILEP